jgi:hypothetical protein
VIALTIMRPLSSGDYRRERSCTRKRAYVSLKNARRARMRMMLRFNAHFEVYHCAYGEHWHVGHAERLIGPPFDPAQDERGK